MLHELWIILAPKEMTPYMFPGLQIHFGLTLSRTRGGGVAPSLHMLHTEALGGRNSPLLPQPFKQASDAGSRESYRLVLDGSMRSMAEQLKNYE